ncbi:MAG: hypothetical protein EOO69_04890 [Moraxellaceae bacterium]|nr:MAG: hypothetical protein EOO69_04890 [Moraxellaceae bacterium]
MNKIEMLQLERALRQRYANWKKIAKSSVDRLEPDEVLNAVFLYIVQDWSKKNPPFDPHNPDHWLLLQKIFWNRLVKHPEKNLKFAERLDHLPQGYDYDEGTHPLLNQLSVPDNTEPLAHLEQQENALAEFEHLTKNINDLGYAKLQAFIILFIALDMNTKIQQASTLLMSYSWLYRCYQRAKELHSRQASLFDSIEAPPIASKLKTWRPFKIVKSAFNAKSGQEQQLDLFSNQT